MKTDAPPPWSPGKSRALAAVLLLTPFFVIAVVSWFADFAEDTGVFVTAILVSLAFVVVVMSLLAALPMPYLAKSGTILVLRDGNRYEASMRRWVFSREPPVALPKRIEVDVHVDLPTPEGPRRVKCSFTLQLVLTYVPVVTIVRGLFWSTLADQAREVLRAGAKSFVERARKSEEGLPSWWAMVHEGSELLDELTRLIGEHSTAELHMRGLAPVPPSGDARPKPRAAGVYR